MSTQGILWQLNPNREYGYGANRASPCVKLFRCPTCRAAAGILCKGKGGPVLDTHYERRKLLSDFHKTVVFTRQKK